MARKERHVVPDQQGGWDAKKPHAERASAHCERGMNQNSECVIHSGDGKIQASDNCINDPCPLKDKNELHVVPDIKGGWIVSRRGHAVPLEKGKEGIHKKFDEVLSSACDC